MPLLGLALVVLWRDWRVPLAGLAGLMVGVPILWLLAGQPLAALPAWLQGSMEVASGYSDAMSTYNGGWFNPLLYAAVALAVLALLWRRLRAGEYHQIQAIALALIGLAAVYYGLKLAFVREQELRLVTSFLVLTPVLFFAIPDGLGRARAAATALVAPTAALIVVPQLATVALWPLASPIGRLRALNLIVSEPAFAAERDRQRADRPSTNTILSRTYLRSCKGTGCKSTRMRRRWRGPTSWTGSQCPSYSCIPPTRPI